MQAATAMPRKNHKKKDLDPKTGKRRVHRSKNPLPPPGTVERAVEVRKLFDMLQTKRRRETVEELAFGETTFPVVLSNGHIAGRVQIDEKKLEMVPNPDNPGQECPTVRHACPPPPRNLEKFSIPVRIEMLRRNAGYSVWIAAKFADLSRRQWARLELGQSRPSVLTAKLLAKLFGVHKDLFIDDPMLPASNG